MQSPLLVFESTLFPVLPGEDAETNPGIYGKSLATWLAGQLAAKGLQPGEPFAEDFGWCVQLEAKPHSLYVACASIDDTPDTWGVFVFAEGGLLARLFGKDERAERIAGAFAAVKGILQQEPRVQNLKEDGK